MRLLIIANIEKLEASAFLVASIYGEGGHKLDEILKLYTDDLEARAALVELMLRYEYNTAELWTSTPKLYKLGLESVGLSTSLKHKSDTTETARIMAGLTDVIRDLYEIESIEPIEEPPSLPKWRQYLINVLTNLIKKLGGNTHG